MSAMLASDGNNPQFVGAHNPDQVLHVEFYNKAVEIPFESSKAGRPVFKDMVYIRITTPGIPIMNTIDRAIREADKIRFPKHWDYFERTQGQSGIVGTPVEQWPFLSKAQAEEMKGAKFYTVEMIANASDQQIGSIGMLGGMAPLAMRERARAYLNAAAGNADKEHTASELAKAKQEIEDMKKQMAAFLAAQQNQGVQAGGVIGTSEAEQPRRETIRKPEKAA